MGTKLRRFSKKWQSQPFNEVGFSLVQVMIAAGILSVLSLGFASLMTQQNKSTQVLQEKMEILDYQRLLQTLVSSDDYCGCIFRNRRFNTNAGSEGLIASDQLTSIGAGFLTGPNATTPCTPAPGFIIPPVGSKLPKSSLIVRSISLTDMSVVSPGNYRANLEVDLISEHRQVKPLRVGVMFNVDINSGSAGARPFASCGAGAPPPPPPVACTTVTHQSGGHNVSQVACPAGYTLTGGGCDGGVTNHLNQSRPNGNGWLCHNWHTQPRNLVAYAVCCQLQ